jgi:MFS family permease
MTSQEQDNMKRDTRWYDYILININYLALTTRSQTLAPLIIPVLVQQFLGDEGKGAAVGTIRLWALMAAVLAQALFGLLSDRSRSKFGRRRPYILFGSVSEVIVFMLIGFAAVTFDGNTGYMVLFVLYIISMLSANLGHAATQSLIPDLVPEEKRGMASGIKALFELPIPVILVAVLIAPQVAKNNLWLALGMTSIVVLLGAGLTMLVKEKPVTDDPAPIDWKSFLNLILMTVVFTAVILGMGEIVNSIGNLATRFDVNFLMVVAGILGMAVAVVIGVRLSITTALGFKETSQRKSYVWWVINRLAFMVGLTNLATFMVYFLQEKFSLVREAAAAPASQVTMLVGVFVLLLAIPTGWLSDRFGKKLLLVISGLVAAGGVAVLLLFPGMLAVYLAGGMIGAAAGIFYSANWALGTNLVPSENPGKYLGIQNLAGAGAGAIGAYLGGPIGDKGGYVILFAIYGCMFLLSALALLGIREPEVKTG